MSVSRWKAMPQEQDSDGNEDCFTGNWKKDDPCKMTGR